MVKVRQDEQQAKKFYSDAMEELKVAANQENADAQIELAEYLLDGTLLIVDKAQAVKWFET